jgi:hypothetical protein
MWITRVNNWANDVKNWATEQGGRPESRTASVPDSGHLGMLRFAQTAQDCTATSSGLLSHYSVLNLVCSG